ncbi:hypothetical protein M011DRAFT_479350 [Sporormia fimetaria CBS 119925]|uniref:Uncharacterized protein n=1 Tax=Sporormia fimetaria CBS 119925 TaxID=1340428 RepID=A0A6A6V6R3_9PLEO|nr:hypothetical protein M011DRAFT_479350 [Sporormia fimetaria CBS 119925]
MRFELLLGPQSWVLLVVGLAVYVYNRVRKTKGVPTGATIPIANAEKNQSSQDAEATYYQIEPLHNFDLETTEPEKLRPFKPKYFLTMAIQNTTMSDLVAKDKTYKERIALRRHLLQTQKDDVLAYTLNPEIWPAVQEFYIWIVGTYLPQRFPTLYTLTPQGLVNKVTNETLPLSPSSIDTALEILGAHIDDDFLFLLPEPCTTQVQDESAQPKYRLEAFITCFPSGFRTRLKLGLNLAGIHGPVPSYKAKLEKSMDKFFATLPAGKIIKRHNWSITTTRQLCLLGGTHLSPEEVAAREARAEKEEVDIDNTVMRCERQTLHRLPKSRAIVFGYKTYQYGIRELRDEGVGEELAQAIEGLGKGNAPGFRAYKREVVWGESVVRFLRGGDVLFFSFAALSQMDEPPSTSQMPPTQKRKRDILLHPLNTLLHSTPISRIPPLSSSSNNVSRTVTPTHHRRLLAWLPRPRIRRPTFRSPLQSPFRSPFTTRPSTLHPTPDDFETAVYRTDPLNRHHVYVDLHHDLPHNHHLRDISEYSHTYPAPVVRVIEHSHESTHASSSPFQATTIIHHYASGPPSSTSSSPTPPHHHHLTIPPSPSPIDPDLHNILSDSPPPHARGSRPPRFSDGS